MYFVAKEDVKDLKLSLDATEFKFFGKHYKVRLLGEHQAYNAALAILGTKVLEDKKLIFLDYDKVCRGLEKTYWPGRLEIISKKPLILVDGAHNIGGIERLFNFLKAVKDDKK